MKILLAYRSSSPQSHVSQSTPAEEKALLPSIPIPNEKEDYQIPNTNPDAHSGEQRRPPNSYGKSGLNENPARLPKWLTAVPCKSGDPSGRESPSPSIPNEKEDYQITKTNPNAHSAVKRRPPDSYGKSGQGETLQACRSGSPHAPWKAGGRSGTERTLSHPYTLSHSPLHQRTCFEASYLKALINDALC